MPCAACDTDPDGDVRAGHGPGRGRAGRLRAEAAQRSAHHSRDEREGEREPTRGGVREKNRERAREREPERERERKLERARETDDEGLSLFLKRRERASERARDKEGSETERKGRLQQRRRAPCGLGGGIGAPAARLGRGPRALMIGAGHRDPPSMAQRGPLPARVQPPGRPGRGRERDRSAPAGGGNGRRWHWARWGGEARFTATADSTRAGPGLRPRRRGGGLLRAGS